MKTLRRLATSRRFFRYTAKADADVTIARTTKSSFVKAIFKKRAMKNWNKAVKNWAQYLKDQCGDVGLPEEIQAFLDEVVDTITEGIETL